MQKTLLEIAKELGIENSEALTPTQLKKAVESKQTKIAAFNALKLRAKELGIVFSDDVSEEDLNSKISAAEEAIEEQRLVDVFNEKTRALIDATIGFESFEKLSADEITESQKTMSELNQKAKSFIEAIVGLEEFEALSIEELIASLNTKSEVSGIEVVVDGKTDRTYKAKNGIEYGFSAAAPGSFRFMNTVKTQEEWISDDDAMDLMVSGNLSYVKPLKK